MYDRILVTVDGSPTSLAGVDEAARLARLTGGRVRLLHVIDGVSTALMDASSHRGELLDTLREGAELILREAGDRVRALGVEVETTLCDQIGQRLSDVVAAEVKSWPADLLVIGTHGRRGAARLILGSDAEKILRSAIVPVLLVRSREHAAANDEAGTPTVVSVPSAALAIE